MANEALDRSAPGVRMIGKLEGLPRLTSLASVWSREDLPRMRLYSELFDPYIEVRSALRTLEPGREELVLVAIHDDGAAAIPGSCAGLVELIEQLAKLLELPTFALVLEGYRALRRGITVSVYRVPPAFTSVALERFRFTAPAPEVVVRKRGG